MDNATLCDFKDDYETKPDLGLSRAQIYRTQQRSALKIWSLDVNQQANNQSNRIDAPVSIIVSVFATLDLL